MPVYSSTAYPHGPQKHPKEAHLYPAAVNVLKQQEAGLIGHQEKRTKRTITHVCIHTIQCSRYSKLHASWHIVCKFVPGWP